MDQQRVRGSGGGAERRLTVETYPHTANDRGLCRGVGGDHVDRCASHRSTTCQLMTEQQMAVQ